jgi:alkylhydroperoxidase family enzyme
MTNTLKPISEPFPDDVAAILDQYPKVDGYLLELFRTFANSVRFLQKGVPNLLDKASPLPLRIREIVILRITANNNCEYEWGVHVAAFSKAAKFSDAQVSQTRSGAIDPSLWSPEEQHLLKAIDELCASGRIEEQTLDRFEADWTVEQQLEILALCGAYHTVSFVANTARLANEKFAATFPE